MVDPASQSGIIVRRGNCECICRLPHRHALTLRRSICSSCRDPQEQCVVKAEVVNLRRGIDKTHNLEVRPDVCIVNGRNACSAPMWCRIHMMMGWQIREVKPARSEWKQASDHETSPHFT
jgi:hypothetical protein